MIFDAVAGARARKGAIVANGNKLKVHVEAHQTIEHLKGLIAKATKGLKRRFELQTHLSKTAVSVCDDGKTLDDCGLVSGSVLCVPQLDIYFVLPPGLFLFAVARKIIIKKQTHAHFANGDI